MDPRYVFLAAFSLIFYGTGAAFIEGFVNYSSWHLIGANEFITYHGFITPRVLTYLVAPLLLGTALTIGLLWIRPAAVPLWAVWAAILLQIVVWISTLLIQVPIQLQLGEKGFAPELMDRLIVSNFWLRRVPYGICAGLFLWMAARTIDAGESGITRSI